MSDEIIWVASGTTHWLGDPITPAGTISSGASILEPQAMSLDPVLDTGSLNRGASPRADPRKSGSRNARAPRAKLPRGSYLSVLLRPKACAVEDDLRNGCRVSSNPTDNATFGGPFKRRCTHP